MKQSTNQKQTIAWFKLHQFIERGEKEKALSICKLLVPSIRDFALAYKLEGDIFTAFNDKETAAEKYFLAARTYMEEKRYIYAAELCEFLDGDDLPLEHMLHLAIIYGKSGNIEKCKERLQQCIVTMINEQKYALAEMIIEQAYTITPECGHLIAEKILLHAPNTPELHAQREFIIKTIVEKSNLNNTSFQLFLSKLKALHEDYYKTTVLLFEQNL